MSRTEGQDHKERQLDKVYIVINIDIHISPHTVFPMLKDHKLLYRVVKLYYIQSHIFSTICGLYLQKIYCNQEKPCHTVYF